jgi:8-oxo-dGTP diphosphatase
MNQAEPYQEHFMDPSSYMPGISIDCVVVGFDREELHILLLKWKDEEIWMLPGGFILLEEDMDQAATRILEERTGIRLPYLAQFHTFGDVNRRDKNMLSTKTDTHRSFLTEYKTFLEKRFISTGYLSLVEMQNCSPTPDNMSDHCAWKPLSGMPELVYDHREIVDIAMMHLRSRINYMPVGISLLPEKFTMKEFQSLYEQILHKELDRGNFQKKMLKLGFLDRHEKQLTGGAHKAPYLYSFNEKRYNELVEKGIGYIS